MNYPFQMTRTILWLLSRHEPQEADGKLILKEGTCYQAPSLKLEDPVAYQPHRLSFNQPLFCDRSKSLYLYSEKSNCANENPLRVELVKRSLDDQTLARIVSECHLSYEILKVGSCYQVYLNLGPKLAYLAYCSSAEYIINDRIMIAYFKSHPGSEVLCDYATAQKHSLVFLLIPLYFSAPALDYSNPEFDYFMREGIYSGWFSNFRKAKKGPGYLVHDGISEIQTRSVKDELGPEDSRYSDKGGKGQLMYAKRSYAEVSTLRLVPCDFYDFVVRYVRDIKEDLDEDIVSELLSVTFSGGEFYYAYQVDEMVGTFIIEKKGQHFCYLSFVALIKEKRGQGLGEPLLQLALNCAYKEQLDVVAAVIEPKLFPLYEKLGFVKKGNWILK